MTGSLYLQIGRNVKHLRAQRKLSQRSLSSASGVHFMTIKDLESGKHESVKLSTLEKIASALQVPVIDLLGTDTVSELTALTQQPVTLTPKPVPLGKIQLGQLSDKALVTLLASTSKEIQRRFGRKA